MKWKGLLVLLMLVPLPARADFLDNVINQAKQATESIIKQTVGDDPDTNPPLTSPLASAQNQTNMTGEQKLAATKAISKGVWRAPLHFHPEVLDDEVWLVNTFGKLYLVSWKVKSYFTLS
jgi:hypothetical protein